MRSWNEVISRNAKLALGAARLEHQKATGKKLSDMAVAKRMSRLLNGGDDRGDASPESCRKGFQRPLREPRKHFWRADYLDAFARAVGVAPERLVSLSYTGGKVTDATYGQWLFQAIGSKLTPTQTRQLASDIEAAVSTAGMIEVLAAVGDAVVKAKTQDEAAIRALRAIQSADPWARSQRKPAQRKSRSSSPIRS